MLTHGMMRCVGGGRWRSMGHERCADLEETDQDVRNPHLVGVAQEPGGGGEEHAAQHIQREVHAERDEFEKSKLIVREQTVQDGTRAESDRHPLLGTACVKTKQKRREYEQCADEIIENSVSSCSDDFHGRAV